MLLILTLNLYYISKVSTRNLYPLSVEQDYRNRSLACRSGCIEIGFFGITAVGCCFDRDWGWQLECLHGFHRSASPGVASPDQASLIGALDLLAKDNRRPLAWEDYPP
jgi:hypothetical protein